MIKRRSQYLVDWRLQLGVVAWVVGILLAMAALFVAAVLVLPHEGNLVQQDSEILLAFLLRTTLTYFGLTVTIVVVALVILTNRIAGPARVVEQALRGLAEHDYDQRTRIRPRDKFQGLARAAGTLRDMLREEAGQRRVLLAEVERALDQGDVDGARRLVHRLQELGKPDAPVPPTTSGRRSPATARATSR